MRLLIPVVAVLALACGLSGCVAYTVASTAVSVTSTVVGTAVDVTGAVVSAPFGGDDEDEKAKD